MDRVHAQKQTWGQWTSAEIQTDLPYRNYLYIGTNTHARWRLFRQRHSFLVCSRVVDHNFHPSYVPYMLLLLPLFSPWLCPCFFPAPPPSSSPSPSVLPHTQGMDCSWGSVGTELCRGRTMPAFLFLSFFAPWGFLPCPAPLHLHLHLLSPSPFIVSSFQISPPGSPSFFVLFLFFTWLTFSHSPQQ